jgi:hypothetical protein
MQTLPVSYISSITTYFNHKIDAFALDKLMLPTLHIMSLHLALRQVLQICENI